ncbi:hypothetical protein [Actinoplanes sp. URMC 104]|uniref:hypothetical protein n=1 Tax=Actinoplanes sp. URMC 104 TaxID=3423409 RepID=UPI003F1C0484
MGTPDDDDPLLYIDQVAELLGRKPSTWRAYAWRDEKRVAEGKPRRVPAPDDPDSDTPKNRRRPRWRRSTIERWRDNRRPGRRTDLPRQAAELRELYESELAVAPSSRAARRTAWLEANHAALRRAAELFADERDELLRHVPVRLHDQVNEALDASDQHIAQNPSATFAAAVCQVLWWLRPDGPVQLPAGTELAAMVRRYGALRDGYESVRETRSLPGPEGR